ncbi:MAG: PAS domain-containing sensor histidine kinase, partial [Proteobacteria bacterium]
MLPDESRSGQEPGPQELLPSETFALRGELEANEEALRQSQEQFRLFVTASSEAIYKMSGDWREMRNLKGLDFIADTDSPSQRWLDKYIPVE